MSTGLQPFSRPAKPTKSNFGSSNYWIPYQKEEHPDYINLEDPRPNRKPTNDLSVNFPKNIAEKIAKTANQWGVEPELALAAAWKETHAGQKSIVARTPEWHKYYGYTNPMQTNSGIFEDYPHIKEHTKTNVAEHTKNVEDWAQQRTKEELTPTWSIDGFRKMFTPSSERISGIVPAATKSIVEYETDMKQLQNISGGVAKLKSLQKKYADNPRMIGARYRGNVGPDNAAAVDFEAFYNALKKDPRMEYYRGLKWQ